MKRPPNAAGHAGSASPPLPVLRGPGRWYDVPIEPVDEPLVAVADIGPRVHGDARYHAVGLPGAGDRILLREGVADRLARVARELPDGRSLVVWDGWRALATQRALFDTQSAHVRAEHPDWDDEAVARETARYVSPPSADPACPAPHITGGAVDLTLADGDGRPLEMGTGFDAFVPQAGATALEARPGPAREHRRALFWAMASQGFTAYVEEWWHFDFGDQFWGSILGVPARYGPIAPG